MKFGDIVEMIKNLQQGDHQENYKQRDYNQNGYRGKDRSDYRDEGYSKYENPYPLKREVCSKCGSEMNADHKFCPNCGGECKKSLECTSCHVQVRPGDPFCSRCGNKQ